MNRPALMLLLAICGTAYAAGARDWPGVTLFLVGAAFFASLCLHRHRRFNRMAGGLDRAALRTVPGPRISACVGAPPNAAAPEAGREQVSGVQP